MHYNRPFFIGVIIGALFALACFYFLYSCAINDCNTVHSLKSYFGLSKGQSFTVADECGMVMGNLMHSISEEDTCRYKCRNRCSTSELDYKSSEFTQKEGQCNSCMCNCK